MSSDRVEFPSPLLRRGFAALAVATAIAVFLVYGMDALALIRYRFDWSPDEGLYLDFARRVWEAPSTLYPHTTIPFPNAYSPLVPVLLAPLVALCPFPLEASRILALAWVLLDCATIYALVRRAASPILALLAAALFLAPLDLSFWHMLVRTDGALLGFWLLASVPLLPKRLERGSETLSWGRAWWGSVLLLASVLSKQTALIHGAPLVLGWLLVDRRGAARLILVLTGLGAASLGLLQALTSGGFLWTMRLWGIHPEQMGLSGYIVSTFLALTWPVLAVVALGAIAAWWKGASPLRDGALLLVVGGFAALPVTRIYGAWWHYLLPGYAGAIIWGMRCFGVAERRAGVGNVFGAGGVLLSSVLALSLVATRQFPLPSRTDAATMSYFYELVSEQLHATGKPLLAATPEYAYFLNHQPVEVEGSGFKYRAEAGAPGSEVVLERLQTGAYGLVVEIPSRWPGGEFSSALAENYTPAIACSLGFFYGQYVYSLDFPVGSRLRLRIPRDVRCQPLSASGGALPPV